MSCTWPENTDDTVSNVMSHDNNDVDFVVFSMVKEGKAFSMTVEDDHVGKGGRAKVEEILQANSDKVQVGVFLVTGVDDRDTTVSYRRKFVYFVCVGENVSPMVRGAVNSLSGDMKSKFSGSHLSLSLNEGDFEPLTEASIEEKLLSAGGAHKPKKFDFTNECLTSA